ncbi:MAG TPA: DUF4389 domain-containing protein [Dehalococcoidia bacterium]|jgi:hypothetical protein|nr:DUF4389 domain-containing protein [Dehalococcoidia bacterium]
MANEVSAYPIRYEVVRSPQQSRLTNFPLAIGTLIRYILAIPHLIILYFFQLVASVVYFIATFAILFTGKYPEGMFNFYTGFLRWHANVYGYLFHLYDNYPPFSTESQAGYPLTFEAEYPPSASRILNFPLFIGFFIKAILLIPHLVVIAFLYLAALVVIFIAEFAILFTGSFPEGMHGFVVGVGRWYYRIFAYAFALTDKYPPFSLK